MTWNNQADAKVSLRHEPDPVTSLDFLSPCLPKIHIVDIARLPLHQTN